jgi:hypothetical protein
VTLAQRLKGCPSGATRAALRLNGHTDVEIDEAVDAGKIQREVRKYRDGAKLEWFTTST